MYCTVRLRFLHPSWVYEASPSPCALWTACSLQGGAICKDRRHQTSLQFSTPRPFHTVTNSGFHWDGRDISPLKKSGDLLRISIIFSSNMAFICLCRVPSPLAPSNGTREGRSSRLSMLPALLDSLSDRPSPLGRGFTCLAWPPWGRVCGGGPCQWPAYLRLAAGVRGEAGCLRGQLRERAVLRMGVGGCWVGGVCRVRRTRSGEDGATRGWGMDLGLGCWAWHSGWSLWSDRGSGCDGG